MITKCSRKRTPMNDLRNLVRVFIRKSNMIPRLHLDDGCIGLLDSPTVGPGRIEYMSQRLGKRQMFSSKYQGFQEDPASFVVLRAVLSLSRPCFLLTTLQTKTIYISRTNHLAHRRLHPHTFCVINTCMWWPHTRVDYAEWPHCGLHYLYNWALPLDFQIPWLRKIVTPFA